MLGLSKNSKGQIGDILLIFVALILIVVSFFVFVSFDDEVGERRQKIREIHYGFDYQNKLLDEELKAFIRKSISEIEGFGTGNFESGFNEELKKYFSDKNRADSGTNFYGKVANDEGYSLDLITNGDEVFYNFEMNDVFVEEKTDYVIMKTTFDYNVRFDNKDIIEFERIVK